MLKQVRIIYKVFSGIVLIAFVLTISKSITFANNYSDTIKNLIVQSENNSFSDTSKIATSDTLKLLYQHYSTIFGTTFSGTENIALLKVMEQWLGTPYKYAASVKQKGTDCSGFVYQVYLEVFKYTLNRSSYDMIHNVVTVDKDSMQLGDILFFKYPKGRIYHVGLYLKNGKFIHSSSGNRRGVVISDLTSDAYYQSRFYTGGRVKLPQMIN